MDIGLLVKQYRQSNHMTLREFAQRGGTSHSYIAMLESQKNSKTGEPIVPTISMLKKLSIGMGVSVNELISMCDDMPINMSVNADMKIDLQLFSENKTPDEPKLPEGEMKMLEVYRRASDDVKPILLDAIEALENMSVEKLRFVADLISK